MKDNYATKKYLRTLNTTELYEVMESLVKELRIVFNFDLFNSGKENYHTWTNEKVINCIAAWKRELLYYEKIKKQAKRNGEIIGAVKVTEILK